MRLFNAIKIGFKRASQKAYLWSSRNDNIIVQSSKYTVSKFKLTNKSTSNRPTIK